MQLPFDKRNLLAIQNIDRKEQGFIHIYSKNAIVKKKKLSENV